jgi:hypothetical protein
VPTASASSPKTPSGAVNITFLIIQMSASVRPFTTFNTGSRFSGASALSPKPRKSEKKRICRMLPSASAWIGFCGMRPRIVAQNPGCSPRPANSAENCERMASTSRPVPGWNMKPSVRPITTAAAVVSM